MPALLGLALDVSISAFTLGVERVKFFVEPFVGRLAGVDGTVQVAVAGFIALGAAWISTTPQ